MPDRPAPDSSMRGEIDSLLLDSIIDRAVIGVDRDGTILNWNVGAERLFGYTAGEIIGQGFARLLVATPDMGATTTKEVFADARQERVADVRWCARSDGTRFCGIVERAPIVDPDGRHYGYAVIIHDSRQSVPPDESLVESEARYRALIDATFDGILMHENRLVIDANQGAANMFGYTLREMIGMDVLELASPDSRDLIRHHIREKFLEPYEIQGLRKDGTAFDMEAVAREHVFGHRRVRVTALRDITERKRAEAAVRESEARLRLLVEQMPAVLWTTDAQLRFTSGVGAGLHSLGLRPNEAEGVSLYEFFQTDDPEYPPLVAHQRALRGESTIFEAEWMGRLYETYTGPLRNADGTITGVIGLAHDITERRRAEEALRSSEERYRELVENANDIIYTHDLEGNFTSLNAAGERLLGYTREDARRLNIADIVPPEHLDNARAMIHRKQAGEERSDFRTQILAKNGQRMAVEVSTRVMFHEGRPVGVLGIARDITERMQTEERLLKEKRFTETMIDSVPGIFYFFDHTGKFLRWNKAFEEVTGYTGEEISRLHPTELFRGSDQQLIAERIGEV